MPRYLLLIVVCGLLAALNFAVTETQDVATETALNSLVFRYYDEAFLAKASAYHRESLVLFFARTAVVFTVVLCLLSRPAFKYAGLVVSIFYRRPWLARLVIVSTVFALLSLIRFPFSLAQFYLAHDYGLRRDSLSAFLTDWAIMKCIAWLTICVPLLAVLSLFARFERWWWVVSGLTLGVSAVCYIMAAPLIIDPIFNEFQKLDDTPLNQQLTDLASKGGVDVQNILVADASRRTLRANAYFAGFLNTQRIVLYDTLLENYSNDEIINVVAHELAHWKQKHIVKGSMMAIGGLLVGFFILHKILSWMLKNRVLGISHRADPTLALPVYAFYIASAYFVMAPANWVSRQMEMEADQISLEITRDPNTFIQTSVKLARQNLSEVLPPVWIEAIFYSHPANARRIQMAEKFRETMLGAE